MYHIKSDILTFQLSQILPDLQLASLAMYGQTLACCSEIGSVR